MKRLQAPAVAAEEYTEEYYRKHCLGHEEWHESEGREISPYYEGMLRAIGLREGEHLVDLGAGRGELVAVALQRGAAYAAGIEYSSAALDLARRTFEAQGVSDRAVILEADVRSVPLPGESADVVTLLDVIEHLTPDEVDAALREALRLLAPGGRLVAHTMPNRLVYDVTYRLQRMVPGRRRRWPPDPRTPFERSMHVNEQTLSTLGTALRGAGFSDVQVTLGEMVAVHFVPDERARRLYWRLAARRPTARYGIYDLWARARRPAV